jgi:4-alpha-glucanotransferase
MDTDCHGIAHQFQDAFGVLRVTSRSTRDAIRRAMHADEPATEPRVRVVNLRRKSAYRVGSGQLLLEEGGVLSISDRLPADVPLGYHDFLPEGSNAPIRLIVSPGRCQAPPAKMSWGWAVQLYAARSATSWGMGDLADLRSLATWSKGLGAAFLLVNPLPAVDPVLPQEASPYFPTSRRFRNPLYLRIEEIAGAGELGHLLEPLATAGRQLQQQDRIRRDEVFRLKKQALELLWNRFSGSPTFESYRGELGAPLRQFATFCVLVERFGSDWSKWDAEYRRPEAPGIARFAAENARRVAYHEWLQWLLDVQLSAAGTLPIVQDMPIGINPRGADAWTWQDVLAEAVSIGAPPDMYNTQGQNWGMPPWTPRRLQAAKYEPFVQTIRALLRHAGGLRIDHVMGLFRLYWIPDGESAVNGTYVEYPAEDLLNIVALESHRAGAFVVGEDLGTVGKNVRQMLAAARILSNRLLWFEDHPTRDYPRLALAAVTTHDLPTIAGLWSGSDLAKQQTLGLSPNAEATNEIRDKLRVMTGLANDAPAVDVVRKTYELMAEAPSALVTATLEDALAIEERPNMPATTYQWPNWCIPLSEKLEALFQAPLAHSIASSLSSRGKRAKRSRATTGANGSATGAHSTDREQQATNGKPRGA